MYYSKDDDMVVGIRSVLRDYVSTPYEYAMKYVRKHIYEELEIIYGSAMKECIVDVTPNKAHTELCINIVSPSQKLYRFDLGCQANENTI